MKHYMQFISASVKKLIIFFIRIYQFFFSFHHCIPGIFFYGRVCRWYPSCSEYAARAISQYGLRKGVMVSVKRIASCHPWSAGGYDPVVRK